MTGLPAPGLSLTQDQPPAPDQLPGPGPASASRELPAPEEISGTLREILAGPDFATFEPPVGNPLLDAVITRLLQLLDWFLEMMDRAPAAVFTLAILIPVLALLAAGVIIVRRRRGAVRRTADGHEPVEEATPVTPAEWLRLASARAGRGRLRSAATALYQGFLLTLDQRGALAFHPSKTPGDYALEIGRDYSAGTDARSGGQFLNSFQGFSFGQEDPTSDGYADLTRLAREAGCPADRPAGAPDPGSDAAPDAGPKKPAGTG